MHGPDQPTTAGGLAHGGILFRLTAIWAAELTKASLQMPYTISRPQWSRDTRITLAWLISFPGKLRPRIRVPADHGGVIEPLLHLHDVSDQGRTCSAFPANKNRTQA